jgi:hypothetical protein
MAMAWPFLTRRAAMLSEEAARALAYAEGLEDGRAEALKELLAAHLKIDKLEKELAQRPADRVSP